MKKIACLAARSLVIFETAATASVAPTGTDQVQYSYMARG